MSLGLAARLRVLQSMKPIEAEETDYAMELFDAYADMFFWERYGSFPDPRCEKRYYGVLWDRNEQRGLRLLLKGAPKIKIEAAQFEDLLRPIS